jgi:hypothetical protein
MYVPEAIPALILCLLSLSHEDTEIYFAYGRNRYMATPPVLLWLEWLNPSPAS